MTHYLYHYPEVSKSTISEMEKDENFITHSEEHYRRYKRMLFGMGLILGMEVYE